MSTTKSFKQTFKVSKSGANAGQKRADVNFVIPQIEVAEVPSLAPEQLVVVVNDALLKFAKAQFLENSDNWNFTPSAETVSLDLLVADILAPRKSATRILTNANLLTFSAAFNKFLAESKNKTPAQLQLFSKIVTSKFSVISSQQDSLEVVAALLAEFEPSDDAGISAIHEALIELITDLLESFTAISASALL